MARPRKDSGEAGARARIIAAFWELLAEKGQVTDVSAGAVAGRAGCNRTTFYYHFKSTDALVEAALGETLPTDGPIIDAVFRAMLTGDLNVFEGAGLERELHHLIVALCSGLAFETNLVARKAIVERWERALYGGERGAARCGAADGEHGSGRKLTSDACFMVQFMLSGVMSYFLATGLAREEAASALMRPRPPAEKAFAYVGRSAENTIAAVAAAEGLTVEDARKRLLAE